MDSPAHIIDPSRLPPRRHARAGDAPILGCTHRRSVTVVVTANVLPMPAPRRPDATEALGESEPICVSERIVEGGQSRTHKEVAPVMRESEARKCLDRAGAHRVVEGRRMIDGYRMTESRRVAYGRGVQRATAAV